MTPRNFLVRGLLAGILSGIFTFAVAYAAGEPQVDAAIAVEDAGAASGHAGGPSDEPATGSHTHSHDGAGSGTVVSRDHQSTWGLATGTFAVSTAIGGVVGLVSAFASGRLGRLRPGQSTALVALIGFVSVALVPFLKYPASPPAVGNPDTIGDRTAQYFTMLAISLLAAIAVVLLARRLLERLGTYRTILAAGGTYLVVVIVAGLLLPTVNEVGDFPGDTLWYFRRASLLTLATMWGAVGIILTGLVGQLYERESAAAARKDLAASL
ncbi:CbtA family protein [Aeromicrobium sp.]|uniref:CbtA family protein n=1 Tax=Aeromicrobium sp. TaxID=1871063 RepID=UPI001987AAE1|nr:CbtA family protein [Aeromicrobium sp.]MBC7630628.1 CbtA family protein [Aeromicrobium sp.]